MMHAILVVKQQRDSELECASTVAEPSRKRYISVLAARLIIERDEARKQAKTDNGESEDVERFRVFVMIMVR